MCGILGCVYCKECHKGLLDDIKKCATSCIVRRGPDSLRNISIHHGDVAVDLVGSVLNMRPPLTPQPMSNDNGDFILWNGEVFGGGLTHDLMVNDTKLILDKLSAASSPSKILDCLASIHGPWALLYWQCLTGEIWFGRDVFGRRSLLWHLPSSNKDCFALCSAAQQYGKALPENFWTEVPSHGLFCLSLSQDSMDKSFITFYPWMQAGRIYQNEVDHMIKQLNTYTCISLSLELNHYLTTPFPEMNKALPSSGIDNIKSLSIIGSDHCDLFSKSTDTLLSDCESDITAAQPAITLGCHDDSRVSSESNLIATKLMDILYEAVRKRVTLIPDDRAVCIKMEQLSGAAYNQMTTMSSARVAILFSGGVDSMVLAALTDRCLPTSESVDLINVAFQHKTSEHSNDAFNVPDRITAVASLTELNQQRRWNLIMVNVSSEELSLKRNSTICHLVHPLVTVLDDSIGCALWFASRGHGVLYPSMQPYQSTARSKENTSLEPVATCVLVGIGADEQLAGYARHRTKYRAYGWEGLIEEVEMDVKRISHRNLGRDDRCIGDHGREARFPFLDENVVSYLHSLSMSDKVNFALPRGEGEKCLLRNMARLLGCTASSRLPKRAIQFGSRIAKLEGNNKEVASDICGRLQHKQ